MVPSNTYINGLTYAALCIPFNGGTLSLCILGYHGILPIIDVMVLSEDMVPPNPVAYHYLHHFLFFWPIKGIIPTFSETPTWESLVCTMDQKLGVAMGCWAAVSNNSGTNSFWLIEITTNKQRVILSADVELDSEAPRIKTPTQSISEVVVECWDATESK